MRLILLILLTVWVIALWTVEPPSGSTQNVVAWGTTALLVFAWVAVLRLRE